MTITPEQLAATAGLILALAVQYIPGLSAWYDTQGPTTKRGIMLAALLVAALGVTVWQCRADGACYSANWETVLVAFVSALLSNQSLARILPISAARRTVRDAATLKNQPPQA